MIEVTLLDKMGTDLSTVNAARVSFAKASEWEIDGYDEEVDLEARTVYSYPIYKLADKDVKLINYLAKHKHTSPFGHAFASFRVKAPVFVARQLVKHRFLRWNETSRRYVDDPPEMFMPDKWRAKADNVKQGSSDEEVHQVNYMGYSYSVDTSVSNLYHAAEDLYERMLKAGVSAEQARMVLPQAMMTEWVWSGSLDAFASMCKLRLDPHTQYESRLVAERVSEEMLKLFPHSWKALMEYGS